MTAATITEVLYDVSDPTVEEVVLSASDGDTFTSKKFGTVRHVIGSLYEDTGSLSIPLSFAVSGSTVTIHCTGLSSQAVALRLRGLK